jgi:hypothetical protein
MQNIFLPLFLADPVDRHVHTAALGPAGYCSFICQNQTLYVY